MGQCTVPEFSACKYSSLVATCASNDCSSAISRLCLPLSSTSDVVGVVVVESDIDKGVERVEFHVMSAFDLLVILCGGVSNADKPLLDLWINAGEDENLLEAPSEKLLRFFMLRLVSSGVLLASEAKIPCMLPSCVRIDSDIEAEAELVVPITGANPRYDFNPRENSSH